MILIKLTDFRKGEFYLNAECIMNLCDVQPEHLASVKSNVVNEPRTTIFLANAGPGASMLVAESKEEIWDMIQGRPFGTFAPGLTSTVQFGNNNYSEVILPNDETYSNT
jgi:uncharacterized protein YlzI (FlbEa/FlbD family)